MSLIAPVHLSNDKKSGYLTVMATLWKFLALVALMFMPLGMSSAQAAPSHDATAGMPMEHCPDQGSDQDGKSPQASCTMACAAALPAVDAPTDETPPFHTQCGSPSVVAALHGLHPDIATPPPKRS